MHCRIDAARSVVDSCFRRTILGHDAGSRASDSDSVEAGPPDGFDDAVRLQRVVEVVPRDAGDDGLNAVVDRRGVQLDAAGVGTANHTD